MFNRAFLLTGAFLAILSSASPLTVTVRDDSNSGREYGETPMLQRRWSIWYFLSYWFGERLWEKWVAQQAKIVF